MQNGSRGTNYAGENAKGFFIFVEGFDAVHAEADEEAGTGAIVHDGDEARRFSIFIQHLCLQGGQSSPVADASGFSPTVPEESEASARSAGREQRQRYRAKSLWRDG